MQLNKQISKIANQCPAEDGFLGVYLSNKTRQVEAFAGGRKDMIDIALIALLKNNRNFRDMVLEVLKEDKLIF